MVLKSIPAVNNTEGYTGRERKRERGLVISNYVFFTVCESPMEGFSEGSSVLRLAVSNETLAVLIFPTY